MVWSVNKIHASSRSNNSTLALRWLFLGLLCRLGAKRTGTHLSSLWMTCNTSYTNLQTNITSKRENAKSQRRWSVVVAVILRD